PRFESAEPSTLGHARSKHPDVAIMNLTLHDEGVLLVLGVAALEDVIEVLVLAPELRGRQPRPRHRVLAIEEIPVRSPVRLACGHRIEGGKQLRTWDRGEHREGRIVDAVVLDEADEPLEIPSRI